MSARAISNDRRQHPREGSVERLQDITYAALRRYGVIAKA
jgi:hypothetical protein